MAEQSTPFNAKNGIVANSTLYAYGGKVGINNASPTFDLTVGNQIWANGSITFGGLGSQAAGLTIGDIKTNFGLTPAKSCFAWNLAAGGELSVIVNRASGRKGGLALFDLDQLGANTDSATLLSYHYSNGYFLYTNAIVQATSQLAVGSNSVINSTSISTGNVFGTIQTPAQLNITSLGQLATLNVAGKTIIGGNTTIGNYCTIDGSSYFSAFSTSNAYFNYTGFFCQTPTIKTVLLASNLNINATSNASFADYSLSGMTVSDSATKYSSILSGAVISGGGLAFGGSFVNMSGLTGDTIKLNYNFSTNSGKTGIGYNYETGQGELDFFINRGAGNRGGINLYDLPNAAGGNPALFFSAAPSYTNVISNTTFLGSNITVSVGNTYFPNNLSIYSNGTFSIGTSPLLTSLDKTGVKIVNNAVSGTLLANSYTLTDGISTSVLKTDSLSASNSSVSGFYGISNTTIGNSVFSYSANSTTVEFDTNGLRTANYSLTGLSVSTNTVVYSSHNATNFVITNLNGSFNANTSVASIVSGSLNTTIKPNSATVANATSSTILDSGSVTAGNASNYATLNSTALAFNGNPAFIAGEVKMLAMSTVPFGWLECDGSLYLKTAYPNLFSNIGSTYGGNTTHFAVPDCRGYAVRGWDHGAGVDAGRALGSKQQDAIIDHKHVTPAPAGTNGFASGSAFGLNGATTGTATTSGLVSGATTATETRMKNIAFMVVIKY